MNFCVSFLTQNAKPLNEVWVSRSAMNSMATHDLKKKKYVHDRTVIPKDGWTTRILVPMKSGTLAKYESSDADNIPINQLVVKVFDKFAVRFRSISVCFNCPARVDNKLFRDK